MCAGATDRQRPPRPVASLGPHPPAHTASGPGRADPPGAAAASAFTAGLGVPPRCWCEWSSICASLSVTLKCKERWHRESRESRQRDEHVEWHPTVRNEKGGFLNGGCAEREQRVSNLGGLGDRPLLQPFALGLRHICEQFRERQAAQVMSSEVTPRSHRPNIHGESR